ncbi:cobalt ECF transporter T component CbiQ [Kovacikia minuta CCNUW1]|uniref:cobalt ECF transporter T component CbiQ n=1 Tax=Kovacikia minuta TaxID=2931930 RepID=UPI001CCF1166|nr:cobalt ECF transporter T component CbiQ [Kovacikia minuta]UBF27556.1 cobalt ECF transporter T component CbiQ [Kovacikia minuta CCNUW1]
MLLLHIGAFHLDVDSKRQTPWHTLTPQTRVLCVLLLLLAIVLTPHGNWLTWAFYGLGILTILLVSQVTVPVLLKRLVVESAFIGVVLIGTLFREGGEVLWQWGWFKITTTGLTVLGSVTLKAFLALVLLNILTLTTSVPALLQALAALRMPPLLVSILASMYRYIAVLVEEFNSMRRAAISRNLMSSNRWQRLVVGNMIGALFIRTYERGERVHLAMLSRGYQGLPPVREMPKGRRRDILALSLTAIFALLGQTVYLVR